MAGCSFQLFGGWKLCFEDGAVAEIPGGKIRLLLAYLLLAYGMPRSRRQIAFDFWPDSTEKQSLSNLRKLIHDLRACVPQIDRYVKITPSYMQWNHERPCYSDVREFELAAQGQTLFELRKAEALYQGELLPGLYADWLYAQRERLAQTYLQVLERLISILEGQREYSPAIFFANKLLAQDNLKEETYRALMRLYAANKNMAGVAQTYERLRTVLQEEFGINPAEETRLLLQRLMQQNDDHSSGINSQTPFFGRIIEWETMLGVWKRAMSGTGAMIVLRGEAGIGKTRLAHEFKEWAGSQGSQTAAASCYPFSGSLSYNPVIAWLRSLPVPQLNPVWLSELTRLLPELRERYPELPEPAPVQENWQFNRWYESIERMLMAKQPLLLLLDDIQWCDRETLQFVSYLLRTDSGVRALLIATMRTDDYVHDAIGHFLSGLRIERKLVEIELAPISKEDTRQLMAATVGEALANRHSSVLYEETTGNPLFIVETLREWQTGTEKRDFRLAPLAVTILEGRLSRLSKEHQQLVTAIAAVGRPVSIEFMAVVINATEETVLERMEQLARRKVVQEHGSGSYDFTHDIIRENAYKSMSFNRRRQLHKQIACALIAAHRQHEAIAAEISFHFELAGLEQEAIPYYEMAAAAAEKLFAHETTIKYYRKLCTLLPSERSLAILMKLGEALIMSGDPNEAENIYRHWLERTGSHVSLGERSFCEVALGNCLRILGKYEEARHYVERALRYFELMDDEDGLSIGYGTLGLLHYYTGNFDLAIHFLTERMKLPASGNRMREDCRFFGIIGALLYDQCEYDQAIHWLKKKAKLAMACQNKPFVGQAMGLLGLVYMDMDQMDRAFDHIIEKMEISHSIGDRIGFAFALGMLGRYYLLCGCCEQAAECFSFCLEESVIVKDWRIAAIMLGIEGYNLFIQERYEEAGLWIDRSIRLCTQLHIPFFECDALYYLSLLRQRQHQYEDALKAAEASLEIASRLKRRDMHYRILVHLLHVKADLGLLHPAEAAENLQALQQQAPRQQEQAAIGYALWKLNPESAEHRTAALLLNEVLYRNSGKEEYFVRLCELTDEEIAAIAPRPMPSLSEAAQNKRLSAQVFAEIDRYLINLAN
ncbi:hypothetical protein J2TS4_17500 [Paenibacillus sp. J2TS4]|nr:hypothetical protein J2TS4_17500 [Paenibacillus sp. J2TS4]